MSSEVIITGHLLSGMVFFRWTIPDCDFLIDGKCGRLSPDFKCFDETFAFGIFAEQKQICIHIILRKRKDKEYTYKLSIMTKNGTTEYKCVEGTKFGHDTKYYASCKFIDVTEAELSKNCLTREGALIVNCTIASTQYPSSDIPSMSLKYVPDFETLTPGDSYIIIIVQDQKFKVHEGIIKAYSPVLSEMLGKDEVVHLIEDDPNTFHNFLYYLNTGNVREISSDELYDLYRIAGKYRVKLLREECMRLMLNSMSIENFCDVMAPALLHKDLVEIASIFFARNVLQILVTDQWLSFLKEHPKEASCFLHCFLKRHLSSRFPVPKNSI